MSAWKLIINETEVVLPENSIVNLNENPDQPAFSNLDVRAELKGKPKVLPLIPNVKGEVTVILVEGDEPFAKVKGSIEGRGVRDDGGYRSVVEGAMANRVKEEFVRFNIISVEYL